MPSTRLKKGDTVLVIAGRDKGSKGKILRVDRERGRVLVEGIGRVKKHTRVSTTSRGSKTGGIETQEAFIHISNVMLLDDDGKRTRVGVRFAEETDTESGQTSNRAVRIARTTGKDI